MDRSRTRLTVGMLALALLLSSCSGWREASHDWAVTAIDGSMLTIVVLVGSGNCNRFERVDLDETPEDVTITAIVSGRDRGPFGGGCDADGNFEILELTLEEPLGERELRGCAPGPDGLGDYFGQIDGGRQGNDCAEVIDGW